MPKEGCESRLAEIIRSQDWLMDSLRAVRELNLPDWYIAAGAVRNMVWNVMHDYPGNSNIVDIDVAYFEKMKASEAKDLELSHRLMANHPLLVGGYWEVVNQARAHQFTYASMTGRPVATSSCDSISYWSETPTCIGARLEHDNSLTICSPYGLNDLFSLVVRPIPKPKRNRALFEERIQKKKWQEIWPKLKIYRD